MSQWIDDALSLNRKVERDLTADTVSDDSNGAIDTTSSVAKANAEREKQRDMEERLKAFKAAQEKADKDGDVSENGTEAEEQSKQDEITRSKAETPANHDDLQKQIDQLKVLLESQQRLVPEGGLNNDVLTKSGARVVWKNILALFMKVPNGAVSNLVFSLKRKDEPTLSIDDAVVIITDADGPLWYAQFDFVRLPGVPQTGG